MILGCRIFTENRRQDVVFGLLYAQMRGWLRRVSETTFWATGRLAELEGEEAIYSESFAQIFTDEAEAKVA